MENSQYAMPARVGEALDLILSQASREGRDCLLEHEVYEFLQTAGCQVPAWYFLEAAALSPEGAGAREGLHPLPEKFSQGWGGTGFDRTRGEQEPVVDVVLKIVSPHIAHKTEVGGVQMVRGSWGEVVGKAQEMLARVPARYGANLEEGGDTRLYPAPYRDLAGEALTEAIARDLRGVLAVERVELEGRGPGRELLAALRYNREFGPVISLGVGGVDTELLGAACKPGLSVVSGSAVCLGRESLLDLFRPTLACRRLLGQTREATPLVTEGDLTSLLDTFITLGRHYSHQVPARLPGGNGETRDTADSDRGGTVPSPWTITELEVNPFGVSGGKLVALDGLLKFRPRTHLPLPRPASSMDAMFKPQSIGIVGVSARSMNMGRLILGNILTFGFYPGRIHIVRPGVETIDGVNCVNSVAELPERVDLFIMAIGAEQVPALMEDLVQYDRAVSVILIPGGMGEKEGGHTIEEGIRDAIRKGRLRGNPLIANGGNCLGVLSRPGRYHTVFIPKEKLPLPTIPGAEEGSNVALISQSGAYMISRMSRLAWLNPRYAVSTGNQVDLTISDYLAHLARDEQVTTFGIYVEGFKDGDGLELARQIKKITGEGTRDVILYKAGRTSEGQVATSGHTASLAGDLQVCESLLRSAGAHITTDFDQFLDLLKLSALMGDRKWAGGRLAALSNAGYEVVGIADNLHQDQWSLELARFSPDTVDRLNRSLVKGRLDGLVDVRNPFDLTPMADDQAHEDALAAFMVDEGVDVILCSTVPLTSTMATLPPGEGVPLEATIHAPGSLVNRLARLAGQTNKPILASIDSGPIYDPMAKALEERGIPTYGTADRAVRTIGHYLSGRQNRR